MSLKTSYNLPIWRHSIFFWIVEIEEFFEVRGEGFFNFLLKVRFAFVERCETTALSTQATGDPSDQLQFATITPYR